MTHSIQINLEDEDYVRIMAFKKVFDTVIEEESDVQTYIQAALESGIEKMLQYIVPQEPEILWKTIVVINKQNPEFFADFAVEMLTHKDNSDDTKEKFKHYIH